MKVILSGATGFIGSEALRQCLRAPAITSIVALSRRALPDSVANDPKLKVVIMKDFTTYPDTVLEELAGAEACIWALGSPRTTRQAEVDYPMAAVNAFTTALAPQLRGSSRFRFVYLSGGMVERDQSKKLWMASDPRKWKGETETWLLEVGSQRSDVLQTFICRPGLVLPTSTLVPSPFISWSRSIKVDELAAFLVNTAVAGSNTQTTEAVPLRTQGQALLKKSGGQ